MIIRSIETDAMPLEELPALCHACGIRPIQAKTCFHCEFVRRMAQAGIYAFVNMRTEYRADGSIVKWKDGKAQ